MAVPVDGDYLLVYGLLNTRSRVLFYCISKICTVEPCVFSTIILVVFLVRERNIGTVAIFHTFLPLHLMFVVQYNCLCVLSTFFYSLCMI